MVSVPRELAVFGRHELILHRATDEAVLGQAPSIVVREVDMDVGEPDGQEGQEEDDLTS